MRYGGSTVVECLGTYVNVNPGVHRGHGAVTHTGLYAQNIYMNSQRGTFFRHPRDSAASLQKNEQYDNAMTARPPGV